MCSDDNTSVEQCQSAHPDVDDDAALFPLMIEALYWVEKKIKLLLVFDLRVQSAD